MCEITCENFYSELPAIEVALKESAFVSLDMEFSKLHEDVANPFTLFDTTENRYSKLRNKVSDITCIQLGLAIFIYDIKNKTFRTKTYSFYTYPQTFYKSDSVVNFQTSCVEFLSKHKFDFNKLFHNRVPYLTDEQEITVKSEMLDTLFFDKYFESNIKFRPIEEELIKVLNIVSEWYDNANDGECTFLEINGCNEPAYIILMQYYLVKKFKYISIEEDNLGLNIIKRKENEDFEILNNHIYENLKQNLLDKMIGVKYLMKLISKLKIPIIGHNCALDIFILCNQFYRPLPEKFQDYKSFLSNNFGPIYDTKLLCKEVKLILPKNVKWMGNSLSEIYSYLEEGDAKIYSDSISIELIGIEKPTNMKLHHAGWDAYYTGYCFVKMIYIIKKYSCKTGTIQQQYTLTELLKSVELFKNKLYSYRLPSNYIDLVENDKNNNYQINYLIVQNKGILYKALDSKKLNYDLNKICNGDMKLLSNYTAIVATPFLNNNRIIDNLKLKYRVENYSKYQSRKRKQYMICIGVIIICTSIPIITYFKK